MMQDKLTRISLFLQIFTRITRISGRESKRHKSIWKKTGKKEYNEIYIRWGFFHNIKSQK